MAQRTPKTLLELSGLSLPNDLPPSLQAQVDQISRHDDLRKRLLLRPAVVSVRKESRKADKSWRYWFLLTGEELAVKFYEQGTGTGGKVGVLVGRAPSLTSPVLIGSSSGPGAFRPWAGGEHGWASKKWEIVKAVEMPVYVELARYTVYLLSIYEKEDELLPWKDDGFEEPATGTYFHMHVPEALGGMQPASLMPTDSEVSIGANLAVPDNELASDRDSDDEHLALQLNQELQQHVHDAAGTE
ncbi:uncharacterized protein HMPREF1541_05417 [Cyphellophora europaea CBS 101466]|uniref:Uncharacterized protein n=1 Tax=Cyphellophora europaea (strain CBS 101466) TaxID=1220924 RepID=W2RTZ4_CYPE1|nr:uncharacterized protein HMPREF1541_05417 [Cyphellophora europaea CBS 101466]ETN39194.1 hypothetical protein HMPREF1541_05417 [Cyphellophora europaea CBS 101466]